MKYKNLYEPRKYLSNANLIEHDIDKKFATLIRFASSVKNADDNQHSVACVILETVNGRMDNCGGGQRLPPDGDEFPAAYQEFGGNSQQYRFVTTSTATARTSTMIANGRLVCNENESFMNNESFKLLENNVVAATGIILADNRINVENVCQEVSKIELPSIEINGKMSVENVCQDTSNVLAREVRVLEDSKPYIADDFVKKATSVTNYSSYGNQGDANILVSEKKIEITGYYHKDVAVIEEAQDHTEKDTLDTPPPLPLTGKLSFRVLSVYIYI